MVKAMLNEFAFYIITWDSIHANLCFQSHKTIEKKGKYLEIKEKSTNFERLN